ncbi:hypothetical protein A6A19_08625 [Actinobacillus delphinicola]|uniref:Flp pilus assembly protein, ATPase n=1 Tax=Actinobacillus delphinicola TaxID=51161 RepID=A0A448TVE7_9PAST|nr:pilus assembly protein [Actinobacillus delphinicola]MDG6898039.1 hypothetical protein [Actinobacillus delphinicola]VEJ09905.1 Flp pilus assembly protein, ATPase [Actinobacillus delphinicola]
MLLLDDEQSPIESANHVVIISRDKKLQTQLTELLRVNSFENTEVIDADCKHCDIALDNKYTTGVIIDIADKTDIDKIVEQIKAIVPQNIWCCVVGTSDSITLAQRLAEVDILYFNSHSQLNVMMERILAGTITIPCNRNTIRLNVYSCKGGIGASFISAMLAYNISQYKRVPTLLAQSQEGSHDLDLMFDRKLQGEVLEFLPNLDLYAGHFGELSEAQRAKYNYIVNDRPIFHMDYVRYQDFIHQCRTFILIVERHVSSLRNAKRFLNYCEQIHRAHGKPLRTFIVVSDIHPAHARSMSNMDVATLLGHEIDAVIPYIPNNNAKSVLAIKLTTRQKTIFRQLAMKIIGVTSRQVKPKNNLSFSSIISKVLGR